jgi:hypothetical protein
VTASIIAIKPAINNNEIVAVDPDQCDQVSGTGLERRRALSSEVPSRHFVWVFSSIAPTRRSVSYYFFAPCISLFGSKLGSKMPALPGRSPVPKKRPCPRETKPYFSDNQLGLAVSFLFRKALVRAPS